MEEADPKKSNRMGDEGTGDKSAGNGGHGEGHNVRSTDKQLTGPLLPGVPGTRSLRSRIGTNTPVLIQSLVGAQWRPEDDSGHALGCEPSTETCSSMWTSKPYGEKSSIDPHHRDLI